MKEVSGNLGRGDQHLFGQNGQGNHGSARDALGRRGERQSGSARFGQEGKTLDFDTAARTAAFELSARRAEEAMGRDRDGGDQDEKEDGDEAEVVLLAQSDWQPFAAQSPADLPAAQGSDGRAEAVSQLADRIEKTLEANIAAAQGRSLSIQVDLDALFGQGGKLIVSLSRTGLDIVLANLPNGTNQVADAAQVLADRLQVRFSRPVRVFSAREAKDVESGTAEAEGGSVLFGPRPVA